MATRMRNLLFYWLIFLGICNDSWCQVVGPLAPPKGRNFEIEVRRCLMKTALSQTHVRERTGRNDGMEIRLYLKILNLPEGTPYCGAFVEWVYRKCGVVSNVQAPAVAYSWQKYPNRIVWNKAPVIGKKAPQRGDVAVFAWRQRNGSSYKVRHHTELVIDWQDDRYGEPDDVEDFVTVGGNTSAPVGVTGGEGVHKKLRDKDIAVISNHVASTLSQKPRPLF
jgi:CHAP domain